MKKIFYLLFAVITMMCAVVSTAQTDLWTWRDGQYTKYEKIDSITFVEPEAADSNIIDGSAQTVFLAWQNGQYSKHEKIDSITFVDPTANSTIADSNIIDGHEYVDLGLPSGLKWATCNVGANKPEEYGDYFAWGETTPKEDYDTISYKFGKDTFNTYPCTKYVINSIYGTVDSLKILLSEDDAATANWGTDWRMPTATELQELLDGCDWEWTDDFNDSGVAGRIGTSKTNGNIIFLPAACEYRGSNLKGTGDGYYWSSSLSKIRSDYAYHQRFSSKYVYCLDGYRGEGMSVRAVFNEVKENIYFTVKFYTSDSSLIETQNVEETKSATAPVAPEKTGYEFVGWSTSFDTVTSNLNVYALYEKKLPYLYVDVEEKDSVEFVQNGKTGYFIVKSATTSSITLYVVYDGNKKEIILSDAASGTAYCSSNLSLMQLSEVETTPTAVLFAKKAGMSRIISPTSVTNTIIADKSKTTSFQLYSEQVYIQGVSVSGSIDNYTYVDLGFESGTKWATYNVGASKPGEYGELYSWGETAPKKSYSLSNYKLSNDSCNTYTKYVMSNEYGTVDSLTTLLAEDDAATANWGAGWRMPTYIEQLELNYGCEWEWTDNFNGSGIAGRIGTSKANGNTIFMPAAGRRYDTVLYDGNGYYWSSSLRNYNSDDVYYIIFSSHYFDTSYGDRYCGQSVRAVVK